MYTKKQRALACMMCAAVLFATLFSVLFLAKEANHHCTGADCPVCESIVQARRTLKQLGTGTIEPICSVPVTDVIAAGFFCLLLPIPFISPVTQKVRMDN